MQKCEIDFTSRALYLDCPNENNIVRIINNAYMLNVIIIKMLLTINELFIIFIMIISTTFKNVIIFGNNFSRILFSGFISVCLHTHYIYTEVAGK